MAEEEVILKINYYCQKLGATSQLAFKKESLEDILNELERLYKICIFNAI